MHAPVRNIDETSGRRKRPRVNHRTNLLDGRHDAENGAGSECIRGKRHDFSTMTITSAGQRAIEKRMNTKKPGVCAPGLLHIFHFYWGGASLLWSSSPFVGWAGNGGGVRKVGGLMKSKNSVISSAAASRAVSGGRPKRVSINLRRDVVSRFTWETKCGFTHGDTTISGTRNPLRVKSPGRSFGPSCGGFASGGTTVNGGT